VKHFIALALTLALTASAADKPSAILEQLVRSGVPAKAFKPSQYSSTSETNTVAYTFKFSELVTVTTWKINPKRNWWISLSNPRIAVRDVVGTSSVTLAKEAPAAKYFRVGAGFFKGSCVMATGDLTNIFSPGYTAIRGDRCE
jgi:hypothetical protein